MFPDLEGMVSLPLFLVLGSMGVRQDDVLRDWLCVEMTRADVSCQRVDLAGGGASSVSG